MISKFPYASPTTPPPLWSGDRKGGLFFPNFETPRQHIKKIETSAGHRAFLFICVLQRAFMALPPWYFTEGCCDREQHREILLSMACLY
jgi:hypothetical protein